MGARACAVMDMVTDHNMLLVHIGNGQIVFYCLKHFLFHFIKVEGRRRFIKSQQETMLDIAVMTAFVFFRRHIQFAEVFRCVRHASVFKRGFHYTVDFAWKRSEKIGSCDYDFFADSDKKMRVELQKRINKLKMLNDNALFIFDCIQYRFSQHMHLSESRFKADIDMIGVRSEKAFVRLVQKRERADIQAVIIVCQFKPRKHTFYKHALAGAGFADYPYQSIKRA